MPTDTTLARFAPYRDDASRVTERAPQRAAAAHVPAAPLVDVDGVTLEYTSERRTIRATHRVDFSVERGDRFVLLGASGCGKSSLLKAIAGFVKPVEGAIRLDGHAIAGPGPDRIVVFQEFDQLPPWKTVVDNVAFPLVASRRCDKREARERALEALAQVRLADFADAYPHTLSGGMKQRAMQPRVLLMDEPFAALDALTRRQMQEELLRLWNEIGFTLIFVTHSIEEALVVGNRVLVLSPRPGRVRAELDAEPFDLASAGSAAFQDKAQRIHRLLFEHDTERGVQA
jgi:NitT/TauT family transport system ATP-binding protein